MEGIAKYTDSKRESNRKWDKANLDRISLALPKGQKDIIQAHAEKTDGSLNKFINRAIKEAMERDESRE